MDEDPKPQLEWLISRQSDLESRIERIENSLLFSSLRTIGRVYQGWLQKLRGASAPSYRKWKSSSGEPISPAPDPWTYHPLISVILSDTALPPPSLVAQTYSNWEACREGKAPAGDYICTLRSSVTLVPAALALAVAAIQEERPDLIYFDHEESDETGRPRRPVFKPAWSPILMRSSNYIGSFFLTHRDATDPPRRSLHIPEIAYSTRDQLWVPEPKRPAPVSQLPKVSVLVCSRNPELLDRCLSSLRAKTNYLNIEIVVVQHAGFGSDKSIEKVIDRYQAIGVPYRGQFNFALMNNIGARAASGDVLAFVNDDIEPIESDWLTVLVTRLLEPGVGLVGPLLLYRNRKIQHAGVTLWMSGGAGHPGRNITGSANWPWLRCTREIGAVTGACLCIRRSDFESANGFDTQFAVNFNDVDLCLRVRERGLSVVLESAAVLYHDESQTRSKGVRAEEMLRFFLRWQRHPLADPYYSPHLIQKEENLALNPNNDVDRQPRFL